MLTVDFISPASYKYIGAEIAFKGHIIIRMNLEKGDGSVSLELVRGDAADHVDKANYTPGMFSFDADDFISLISDLERELKDYFSKSQGEVI